MKKNLLVLLIFLLFLSSQCARKSKIEVDPLERTNDKLFYEKAFKYIKSDPEKARLLLKEMMQMFPESIYAAKAKLAIADSYFREKDAASLVMAASEYQEYLALFPLSPDSVYAKSQIALCYDKQVKKPGRDQTNTRLAIEAYKSLIEQFPETPEAEIARKRITEFEFNLAHHIYLIGYYNYKYRSYQGALNRFRQLMDEYPGYRYMDRVLYFQALAQIKLGENDSAIESLRQLVTNYQKSNYFRRAQKKLARLVYKKEAGVKNR